MKPLLAFVLSLSLLSVGSEAAASKPNGLPKTTAGTRHQIALEPLLYQVPMLFRGLG